MCLFHLQNKLDELFDRSANITSHVTSLENTWPDYKQKIINLGQDVPRLEKDVSGVMLSGSQVYKLDGYRQRSHLIGLLYIRDLLECIEMPSSSLHTE